jgi:hypothetical protein
MATSQFEQFKSLLALALDDVDFKRKNTIFQNEDYLAAQQSRVSVLTPDISISQTSDDVESALGMLINEKPERRIRFDPRGFETTFSSFREGTISDPRRFWKRENETDGVRYLLSDKVGGVFLMNSSLEVLRRFPTLDATNVVAGSTYDDATDAITFTVGATEYVAIAMEGRAIVRIYEYADPFSLVATIGTPDAPGIDGAGLTEPAALAFDSDNDRLFVGCTTGQPTGASADNGFVDVYDLSTPSTPVYEDTALFFNLTGSLLDAEVTGPTDLFFDETSELLWVVNGNDEVGAFTINTTTPSYGLRKFLEPSGRGYTLRNPQQLYIQESIGGFKRVYVSNGDTGTLEEFDELTMIHQNTYGYRASEDELSLFNRLSDSVYGALGFAHGVVPDRIFIDDQETDVLVASDNINKRIHRFNLTAYSTENFVNFQLLTFDVPIMVNGWTVSGTVPLDLVKVFFRFSLTEDFRELPPETALTPSSTLQFRVALQLDTRRFVRDWIIRHLRIHGVQA